MASAIEVFAHAIDAARRVMAHSASFRDIAVDLYWVFGYTVLFFAIGVFLFRRKMVE